MQTDAIGRAGSCQLAPGSLTTISFDPANSSVQYGYVIMMQPGMALRLWIPSAWEIWGVGCHIPDW